MPEELTIGEIIVYADVPLALIMKPHNAPSVWKVGLFLEHKSSKTYIIMDDTGKIRECARGMVKRYQS